MILDLDGDGSVEADAIAHFDYAGDGSAELTRWAGVDDGVLVWDRNGDGEIGDGSELFGDRTVLSNGRAAEHGFAALAGLDSDGDGDVDSQDTHWGDLRILRWSDTNGNGMVDDGEERLATLQAEGVSSLSATHRDSDLVDESGNEHRLVGSYTKSDGTTATMTDVWLVTSPAVAENDRAGIPAHSVLIQGLPDVKGSGRLHDLRDAMALDDAGLLRAPFYGAARTETRSLSALVAAFKAEADAATREDLAERILHRWAGAEGATGRDYQAGNLAFTTPQRFAVVEAFRGEQLWDGLGYRIPAYETSQKINALYSSHLEYLLGSLMLQTHLSSLMDAAVWSGPGLPVAEDDEEEAEGSAGEGASGASGASGGSDAAEESTTETETPPPSLDDYSLDFSPVATLLETAGSTRRGELLRSLAGVYGDGWMRDQIAASAPGWLHEYDWHARWAGYGSHAGTNARSDDYIGRDPRPDGTGGVDVFRTTDGASDTLHGRGGDDEYQLLRGTGHDNIEEWWRAEDAPEGNDLVRVAPGIGTAQVSLTRTREHLVVSLLDTEGAVTDSLRVKNHFVWEGARIEGVVFGDGTVWGEDEFAATKLSGGRGTLGRDTFDGSLDSRNEHLQGGGSSDTYWFGTGSGHDTVDEVAYARADESGITDVIRVKDGILPGSVRYRRDNRDLVVELVDADGSVTDSLRVLEQYSSGVGGIEQVRFADGTVKGAADLEGVAYGSGRGSDGADVFDGTFQSSGAVMQGGLGGDVYLFGRGAGPDTVDEESYGYNRGTAARGGDVVRLAAGLSASDLSLTRTRHDLQVNIRDGRRVTDTLTVRGHYRSDHAKIERVELSDGTVVWDSDDFQRVRWRAPVFRNSTAEISGRSGNDHLNGSSSRNDLFDSDAGGNDYLYGRGGNDTYLLGRGTGHDTIRESSQNTQGDSGDTIRVKAGIGTGLVRLVRSKDGEHLTVQLLNAAGSVTDSLKVEYHYTRVNARVERVEFSDGTVWDLGVLMAAEIVGGTGADLLTGVSGVNDVIDGDAGGNDRLYGRGGDDIYLLGRGTGHDRIFEDDQNTAGDLGDTIRVKPGITPSQARLVRGNNGDHMTVELLDSSGSVTDSLKVEYHYARVAARIERVEFSDGTVWGADEFLVAEITGGAGVDHLNGKALLHDVFDSDAGGNDHLYGRGGNDVYLLGKGTGHDKIREDYQNTEGDSGDTIRIKAGIGTGSVRLVRSNDGNDLKVQLLNDSGTVTDSLVVAHHYRDDNAKIERVEFADGTVWDSDDFAVAAIVGGTGADHLNGKSGFGDVFDGDAGGNDHYYGRGGDDVYVLGQGTDHDRIHEDHQNTEGDIGDVIRVESGISASQVRLARDKYGKHLIVQVLDGSGSVTDSLQVMHHFTRENAEVERVDFSDGTHWDADDYALAEIMGGASNDRLYGLSGMDDVFDGDAGGDDWLHGYSGDDTYLLGRGTGHDQIHEDAHNPDGDSGDVIRVKAGITRSQVVLSNVDGDLVVSIQDAAGQTTDSLTVKRHFTSGSAAVERIEADGRHLLAQDYTRMINAIAEFRAGNSAFGTMNELLGSFWQEDDTLTSPMDG